MSEPVIDVLETVSRFLLKDELRPDKKTIKYTAFMPPPHLRHSVFQVSGLSDQQIWGLAVEKVEPARGRVIGRGDLKVSQIMVRRLRVLPDVDPESRHANIVDWPPTRDERATIAKDLAADAYPAKVRE